jgi:2-keto-4-pentenoate hydratase/2-oxohepta-3-ene-1,7-dioic acid hydratase in catechol pathway
MKLLRYGTPGAEQPGLVDSDGAIRSLVGIVPDIANDVLSAEGLERLRKLDPKALTLVKGPVRLGPCVGGITKVVGVAQNYSCFVEQAGLPEPKHPILFIKPTSSITGPDDDILLPSDAEKADWEVELGVVISKAARKVSPENAMDYIAGYCVLNDITERGRFAKTGQYVDGKSADTFTPVGPYLVTKDEVADHRNLRIYFDLNGQRYQNGNTSLMIFGVETLLSHISTLMTLMPGDIIATGTPMGVGGRSTPPRFLRVGDRLSASIDGMGQQNARVVADS